MASPDHICVGVTGTFCFVDTDERQLHVRDEPNPPKSLRGNRSANLVDQPERTSAIEGTAVIFGAVVKDQTGPDIVAPVVCATTCQ
jgi:hypothetical protein